MSRSSVSSTTLIRSHSPESREQDLLAREDPLEIRLEYGPENNRQQSRLAVTMRTPGEDEDLAAGFLFTEAIINEQQELLSVHHCETVSEEERGNVIRAVLDPELDLDMSRLQRNFYTSSSCGVCGKGSIESVQVHCRRVEGGDSIRENVVRTGPELLRNAQQVFEYTGGLHAAGLIHASGELLALKEDVGRHNALDKLIGSEWLGKNRFSEGFVMLSGRASFELVQKAARAGIPVLAAVGAPSSLAVELAEKFGITLLGFVRDNSFNCYTHSERILFA